MLRAAVLLALVAIACAASPFTFDANAPVFVRTQNDERFIPFGNRILVEPYNAKAGSYFRVLSNNQASPNSVDRVRTYFGEAGRERWQNENGEGIVAQGQLRVSQSDLAEEYVDPRFEQALSLETTNRFLSVATYWRRLGTRPINAGDIVYVIPDSEIDITLNGRMNRFSVVNVNNVLGTYTLVPRNAGEDFPSHIVGRQFSDPATFF